MSAMMKDEMPVTQGQIALLEGYIEAKLAEQALQVQELADENSRLRKQVETLKNRVEVNEVTATCFEGRAPTNVVQDDVMTSKDIQNMRDTLKDMKSKCLKFEPSQWVNEWAKYKLANRPDPETVIDRFDDRFDAENYTATGLSPRKKAMDLVADKKALYEEQNAICKAAVAYAEAQDGKSLEKLAKYAETQGLKLVFAKSVVDSESPYMVSANGVVIWPTAEG